MQIPYYQINAFTRSVSGGNPAGVCVLDTWLPDATLQAIAAENGLSETAFLLRQHDGYGLRWFTPTVEVDLCGHATLASAYAIFNYIDPKAGNIVFATRGGRLTVERHGDLISMDFPAWTLQPVDAPDALIKGLGVTPKEVWRGRDYVAVFDTQDRIEALQPQADWLARLDCMGICATAPGRDADFVSRFFAPRAGIPEDPVTGSVHSSLIPYWSQRLGKAQLRALQLSRRGGELFCQARGERVGIAGHAVLYLEGLIHC
jgi:PhzF family phenazine biosynthesis protein